MHMNMHHKLQTETQEKVESRARSSGLALYVTSSWGICKFAMSAGC